MHFAHGWPRSLATRACGAPVALHVSGGCVALVTAHCLELWSAGRNRVRLASLDCGGEEEDGGSGTNIAAAWSGSRRRLAVLTSGGLLRIYAVHVNESPALPASAIPAEAALLVDDPASAAAAAAAAAAGAPPPGSGPAAAAGLRAATLWLADEVDLGGELPTRLDPDRHASASPTEGGGGGGGGGGGAGSPDRAPASAPALARALSWPRPRRPAALASDGGARLLVGFADGELVSLTWSGSARSRARPFDAPGAFPGARPAPLEPVLRRASSAAVSDACGGGGPAAETPSSCGDGPGAGAVAFARHLAARLVEEQADDAAAAEAAGVPTVAALPPLPRRASASGLLPAAATPSASPPPSPLVALHFCPRARVLAAAFADGRVCVAAAAQGFSGGGRPAAGGPADGLCIPRWVRGRRAGGGGGRARRPSSPASASPSSALGSLHEEDEPPAVTSLAVSGEAGLLAVGLVDGRTEIHPLAAPARAAALAAATRATAASAAAAAAAARAGAAPAAVSAAVAAAAAAAAADAAVAAQAPPLRVFSPWADEDGGQGPPSTSSRAARPRRGAGPVSALAWSPCGSTLAVGWGGGGLCAWTAAGCRLFASAPPEAAGGGCGGTGGGPPHPPRAGGSLEAPAAALAWAAGGCRLLIAQPGASPSCPASLVEVSLARGVAAGCGLRAGPAAALLADDRVFVVRGGGGAYPPALWETRPPAAYIDANWPLHTASASPDGAHVAVAGRRGLALVATGLGGGGEGGHAGSGPLPPPSTAAAGRWSLFGDVAQERDLAVAWLAWLPGCVVVVASAEPAGGGGAPAAPGVPPPSPPPPTAGAAASRPDLRIYSRARLDRDGLLASRRLARPPVALDAGGGGFILAAFAPMDVLLLRFEPRGGGAAARTPDGSVMHAAGGDLVAVRELSILASGPPVRGIALAWMGGGDSGGGSGGGGGGGGEDNPADAPPAHAAVLRFGGSLGLLDMATGSEAPVAAGVESAWLPPLGGSGGGDGSSSGGGPPPPPAPQPWWVHGPAGGRMILPEGGEVGGRAQDGAAHPPDPELAFDGEVAPCLVTPGPRGAVVGLRQRCVRGSGGSGGDAVPLFLPAPAAQPTLSVLLRRLLATGRTEDAAAVAGGAAGAPHFARALEWLVAAALMAAPPSPLLAASTALARRFPASYADTVVAVARKTDAAHWPALFAAAGPPSELLCDAAAAGDLEGAAACLLVVDRVEGAAAAAGPALALLKAALEARRFRLAAELLRFACPPAAGGGGGGGGDGGGGGGGGHGSQGCSLRPPRPLGRAPALPWRKGQAEPPPPTMRAATGWLPSLWRTVAPPPPTPADEDEAAAPAAAAAWCQVAAAAWRLIAADPPDVAGMRRLGRALGDDGASLADALCCVPRPAVGGGGEGAPPAAPRRMSGGTVLEVVAAATAAFPGLASGDEADAADAAMVADAAAAAGEADWAVAVALLLASSRDSEADGARLAALAAQHPLLWSAFSREAGLDGEASGGCKLAPGVAAAARRAAAGQRA